MPETGNNNAINPVIDLVDETFDISQAGSYYLFLQTGPEGLAFCVFNAVISKYIVLRHYPFSGTDGNSNAIVGLCRNIFADDNLLGLSYKVCSHLWVSPRSTLAPEHLFDPADAAEYLNFNMGWNADECVMHNQVRSAKLYNIFSCPKPLASLLRQYQPTVTFFHHATPFIDGLSVESLSSSKTRVAVHYYADNMDILAVKARKLLFYNTFRISTPQDSVFYLAGVLNLFDMKPAATKLFYAGNLNEIPPHAKIIRDYVDRTVECEPLDTVTYSHYLTGQIRTRFIHLFNLYACVS
jgi:hypothetical protein